jgi:hypothetical protein
VRFGLVDMTLSILVQQVQLASSKSSWHLANWHACISCCILPTGIQQLQLASCQLASFATSICPFKFGAASPAGMLPTGITCPFCQTTYQSHKAACTLQPAADTDLPRVRACLAGNGNANRYGYTWSNAGVPIIIVSVMPHCLICCYRVLTKLCCL